MTAENSKYAAYLRLLAWIACILLFMFCIAPLLQVIPGVRSAVQVMDQRDIEAGTYIYSETEQFGSANAIMENGMRYMK